MSKITPCLWFEDNIEEAVNFYLSVFPDARITKSSRYGKGGPKPEGTMLTVSFELAGRSLMALNGGPMFKFNEAVSFVVDCEGQEEVDHYWHKLIEGGGSESMCGWLKDRYGLSWQIVPGALMRYMTDKDSTKASRVMQAMLKMKKIVIADLDAAAAAG